MDSFWRWQGDTLLLALHLQPGASRNEFVGAHAERFKIRIAAPAVDGKANTQLIAFLADAFAVPKMQVVIERGDSSRQKTVRIEDPRQLPPELGIAARPVSK